MSQNVILFARAFPPLTRDSIKKGQFMIVSYDGLWLLLKEKGLRKQNLVDDVKISPVTVAKMGKGQLVTGKVIDRICNHLNCQANDIMKVK